MIYVLCVFVGGLLVIAGYFLTKLDTLIARRTCVSEEIGVEHRHSREPDGKEKNSNEKIPVEEQLEKMMAYNPFARGEQ